MSTCQDTEFVDPSTLAPLGGDAEFAELVEGMVADCVPRVFAVVQEYGNRADGAIAAWGIAFDDHVEVISVDGRLHLSVRTPERTLVCFRHRPHIAARVVWVNPDAATPTGTA